MSEGIMKHVHFLSEKNIGDKEEVLSSAVLYRSSPKHERYRTKEDRVFTFKNWPIALHQTPEDLASAGFFYTGTGDRVICYECNLGLKDWEEGDIPIEEHKRWRANCSFLKWLSTEDKKLSKMNKHQSVRYVPYNPRNVKMEILQCAPKQEQQLCFAELKSREILQFIKLCMQLNDTKEKQQINLLLQDVRTERSMLEQQRACSGGALGAASSSRNPAQFSRIRASQSSTSPRHPLSSAHTWLHGRLDFVFKLVAASGGKADVFLIWKRCMTFEDVAKQRIFKGHYFSAEQSESLSPRRVLTTEVSIHHPPHKSHRRAGHNVPRYLRMSCYSCQSPEYTSFVLPDLQAHEGRSRQRQLVPHGPVSQFFLIKFTRLDSSLARPVVIVNTFDQIFEDIHDDVVELATYVEVTYVKGTAAQGRYSEFRDEVKDQEKIMTREREEKKGNKQNKLKRSAAGNQAVLVGSRLIDLVTFPGPASRPYSPCSSSV
ncbi:hypothetical protein B566_EDAN003722 [Ephemera danica]|nr:hypothetical protein B566_EDAN003722 [Ephemera danica]